MTRLVLDTNVIVSGLISPGGAPAALLDMVRRGRARLVTSPAQLDEVDDVLARPRLRRFLTPGAVEIFSDTLDASAEVVAGELPIVTDSPDPADNLILATAIAGAAELLASGDKRHMLALGSIRGIPIVTPVEALRRVRPALPSEGAENSDG